MDCKANVVPQNKFIKMKRVPQEIVPVDFLEEIDRIEKRAKYNVQTMETFARRKYFVVVEGPETGIFPAYNSIWKWDGWVYKQFRNKNDACEWFDRSLRLPSLRDISACEIHTSGRCSDVTQDKDWYAAVAVYFGPDDKRTFCKQANTNSYHTEWLPFAAFVDALNVAPIDQPLRIFTDSKRIAYGLNYGLKTWSKHDLDFTFSSSIWWQKINELLTHRREEMQQVIAIAYKKEKTNIAFEMVERCCGLQNRGEIPNFTSVFIQEQCRTWMLCAKRITRLNIDVIRKIARLLWVGKHDGRSNNIMYLK